jgi:flavin reductase (DIM6/NTAB) family NADH-FMN oxidoreductase RutF
MTGLDLFGAVLRRPAATVTVVTAEGDRPTGFIATSFTQVSRRPPLVSFRLDRGSPDWHTVESARHLAVHVFATGRLEFAGRAWWPGPYGVPLLDGALAWLICRVVDRVAAGEHTTVLAEPVAAEWAVGTPVICADGRYACLY